MQTMKAHYVFRGADVVVVLDRYGAFMKYGYRKQIRYTRFTSEMISFNPLSLSELAEYKDYVKSNYTMELRCGQ